MQHDVHDRQRDVVPAGLDCLIGGRRRRVLAALDRQRRLLRCGRSTGAPTALVGIDADRSARAAPPPSLDFPSNSAAWIRRSPRWYAVAHLNNEET